MARIYLLSLLLLISVSCSRSLEKEARLSFQFKEAVSSSASTGYFPAKIIINVRYDGQTYFQEWDCPYQHGEMQGYDVSDCKLPSSITLAKQFPSGPGRLIQVLMVSKNADDTLMEFSYSDKSLAFTGGQQSVIIGESWDTTSDLVEGTVQGRFHSDTINVNSLSGRVIGYYQPEDSSKPAMEVIHDTIFAGWFDFMFLNNNVKLTYKHKDSGTVLFHKKSIENIDEQATGDKQLLKISMPAHSRIHSHNEDATYAYEATNLTGWEIVGGGTDLSFLDDGYADNSIAPNGSFDPGELLLDFGILSNIDTLNVIFSVPGPVDESVHLTFYEDSNPIAEINDVVPMGTNYNRHISVDTQGAIDLIRLALPDYTNISISEIEVFKTVYHSSAKAARDFYIGFYDIDTQSFKTGNSGSTGVNHSTSTELYNGQTGTSRLAVSNSIEVDDNGTWLGRETDLLDDSNFLIFDVNSSADNNITVTYGPPALASGCYDLTQQCINVVAGKITSSRVLQYNGPLKGDITMNCGGVSTSPCEVTYTLLPGVTLALEFFKLPSRVNIDENEDFNCEAMGAAGYSIGVIASGDTNAEVTQSNLNNDLIYYCPVKVNGAMKKYYGWGERVYYRPL